MTDFYTSDLHFFHRRICEFTQRPYIDNVSRIALLEKYAGKDLTSSDYLNELKLIVDAEVAAMNAGLIAQWNKQVKPTDDVYHLGDFVFGGIEKIKSILSQLNGRKHFILGNHDDIKHWKKIEEMKVEYNIAWVRDLCHVSIEKQGIALCHYPIAAWRDYHHGAWHLHGHSHSSLPQEEMKRLDVGIDNAFKMYGEHRLFSFEDIKTFMDSKPIHKADHHDERTN